MLYYLHSGLLLILSLRSGSHPSSNLGLQAPTAGDRKKKTLVRKVCF